ncbi:MAG: sodium/glutamate symporter [Stenotrophomonas sp.]
MFELDAIQTVAFGGLVLFLGYALCRYIPLLGRYNLPEPVVGGLVIALVSWWAYSQGSALYTLDTSLQQPLMIAFFTTIGLNASLALLRVSLLPVLVFLALSVFFAIAQNLIGIGVASAFGINPLFGVLAGSATLTGGPATGLAFAPMFEKAGLVGAESIAVTSAMAGIILGGVIGGPVITKLIAQQKVVTPGVKASDKQANLPGPDPQRVHIENDGDREFNALKSIVILLLLLWVGGWISKGFTAIGLTLPAYIGAMLAGAIVRNIDDFTGWFKLSIHTLELIGNVCLALFLAVALMNLKLWELAGMGAPLLVNLVLQVLAVSAFAWVIFKVMGRDYDAAVMGGGFIGFMLGTTANAMAVMRKLSARYGLAPRAFLVAPLIGAFFIDFANALIITGFVNFWPH